MSFTVDASLSVDLSHLGWYDSGVVVPFGEHVYIVATGTGFVLAFGSVDGHDHVVTPAGCSPPKAQTSPEPAYGQATAVREVPGPITVTAHCLVCGFKDDGAGAPNRALNDPDYSGGDHGFCPNVNPYTYTSSDDLQIDQRLWFQFNGYGARDFFGNPVYYPYYSGTFDVRIVSDLAFLDPIPAPTITACQPCCERAVRVKWTAVDAHDLAGYHLYRDGELVATTGTTTLKYLDTAVDVGSTYEYSVRAYRNDIEGQMSITASVTVHGWQGVPEPACKWTTPNIPANGWTTKGCDCEE